MQSSKVRLGVVRVEGRVAGVFAEVGGARVEGEVGVAAVDVVLEGGVAHARLSQRREGEGPARADMGMETTRFCGWWIDTGTDR